MVKAKEVFEFFGGAPEAARALGLTRQAVWAWGEDVPANRVEHCRAVMRLTHLEGLRRAREDRRNERKKKARAVKKAASAVGSGSAKAGDIE